MPAGDEARGPWASIVEDPGGTSLVGLLLAAAIAVPILNQLVPASSPFHVSTYLLTLIGKYLCYAMLAMAVDLVWGYCGILSLGHAAFFTLGGYAMGMYLMRQIGARGVYGNPVLPDFMVFLNWDKLPWFWYGFNHFWFAMLMVVLVPALLALVFGWLAFRSRVTGVYLSIMTQALSYAMMLAFFRNDMGFGGNNGFTDFKDLLGFDLHKDSTRVVLFVATAAALAAAYLACRAITTSRAGRVIRAIRDAESRTRFLGYRVESYKLWTFVFSAVTGRDRRSAVCAAGRHHQPERVRAHQLDRSRDLGRRGRARNARRGGGRRRARQLREDVFHRRAARGVALRAGRDVRPDHAVPAPWPHGPRPGSERRAMIEPLPPELLRGTILELTDLTVSFDGFKALNALSLKIETGELRCIIGPNGAGKTTMMDVVTGKTRPDHGSAFFGKINLLELSEPEIAQAGIGRKFQKPTVFERLTVFENLELSLWGDKRFLKALLARLSRAQSDHIRDVLEVIGLTSERRHAGRRAVARAEAVAGDRDAAHAGAGRAARRRAGRRHDAAGDRTHRRAPAVAQGRAHGHRR